MYIYDTSKRKKVKFEPVSPMRANIYLCGPTVYDDAHLGHAKSAISFDLLRRTLSELGYKVKFVRNYTDIDDKILKKMAESGESLEAITDRYIASYERDMSALNVLEPDVKPKATQTLKEMIEYIEILLKNGFAYEIAGDGVYFDTAKDAEYLSLSGKFDTEANIARVESNLQKEDKKDFVLWKFDEKWYESPFGRGRPGWHTECVAMIKKHLSSGEKFEIDIHAGGLDLLFPHHENEAAQCRCAERKSLAKYWLHNGFVQVNNEKMSKSLGNVIDPLVSIEEYSADVLRFTLALLAVQGRDIKLSDEKMKLVRNFTNKLYNASKYLLLNESKFANLSDAKIETKLGKYMLSRFNECVREVRENIDAYRFNDAANAIYKFLWDEFCDWGIELSKADKGSVKELGAIFKEAMRLLSPFMPFISEYLFHELSGSNLENASSIMVEEYPQANERDLQIEKTFELVIEAIVAIRRAKATIEQGNSKIPKAFIKLNGNENLTEATNYIALLAKCEQIEFCDAKIENAARDVSENLEAFVPLEGVDMSAVIMRLRSQKTKLEKEIAKLSSMLNNEKFVASAPQAVVEANREGLASAIQKLEKVDSELVNLGAAD